MKTAGAVWLTVELANEVLLWSHRVPHWSVGGASWRADPGHCAMFWGLTSNIPQNRAAVNSLGYFWLPTGYKTTDWGKPLLFNWVNYQLLLLFTVRRRKTSQRGEWPLLKFIWTCENQISSDETENGVLTIKLNLFKSTFSFVRSMFQVRKVRFKVQTNKNVNLITILTNVLLLCEVVQYLYRIYKLLWRL